MRGLMQLEEAYAVEITKLVECVDSKEGRSTNSDWQNASTQHQLSGVSDRFEASRWKYREEQDKLKTA
jgi:hypothetical protein